MRAAARDTLGRESNLQSLQIKAGVDPFRLLADSAKDCAIFLLDSEGNVSSWNSGAERLEGYRADEILGRNFSVFYRQEDRDHGKPAEALRIARAIGRSEVEGWRRRKDGSLFWAAIVMTPLRDRRGRLLGFSKVTRDFTDRKRAKEALNERERRWQAIFENSTVGVVLIDLQGKFLRANRAYQEMAGYTEPELLGMTLEDVTHDHDWNAASNRIESLTLGKLDHIDIEKRFRRKDGAFVWTHASTSLVRDIHGEPQYIVGVISNINERKRAEEELQHSLKQSRALAARLQSAREEERKRIAREVHDDLGQALTAIKIELSSLSCGEHTRESARARSVMSLIDETLRSVQKISTELRPGVLDDLGLAAAIEWAGEDFAARSGTRCLLSLPGSNVAVDPEPATALFRIFQETLTNVARHAQATQVRVRLSESNGDLRLEVSDNGRGASHAQISGAHSLGILGMRERAELLGGDFEVKTARGGGTSVFVRIPKLAPAAENE